jgi:hypothetical protein
MVIFSRKKAHSRWAGLGCLNFSHSAHKADKCKCSLCRHNAVAAALEALGAAIVHPVGQPINHSVKAGFKRRGEVGPLLDDSGPCWVGWAWCEDSAVAVRLCLFSIDAPHVSLG